MKVLFRWLIVSILADWKGLRQKQIGARVGMAAKQVSQYLQPNKELKDEPYERLLAGLDARPAEVAIATGAVESLHGLVVETSGLTLAEREWVEITGLEISRLVRSALEEAALKSRQLPPLDEYPQPGSLEAARWHAAVLYSLLQDLPEDQQLAVVRHGRQFRSWALLERYCEESEVQASRDLERAAFLVRVAQEIAERIQGPPEWCNCVLAFALGYFANIVRVSGELKEARAAMEEAKRLWQSGSDPDGVLDPGRLLDLEASLLRAERRFQEALKRLDEAYPVSHSPARILIKKGFTLEVMGDPERAIEALRQAESLPDLQADRRLRSIRDCNLGFCLVHAGRFTEAAGLAQKVREVAIEMGDEIWLLRALWLDGRICAGLGRRGEALRFLAQARRGFKRRNMSYDVALALLEEAVLLLEQGLTAAVKKLAEELAGVFKSKGVHREALAALELFRSAAEREEATAELARDLLAFLFRARYDQGLRFSEASVLPARGVPPAAGFGLRRQNLQAAGVNPSAFVAEAAGVNPAACFAEAVGVNPAAFLGERAAPEGGEEGPERIEQTGRGQQGQGEGEGDQGASHRRFSCAAPVASLLGPRGPRLQGHGAKNPPSRLVGAEIRPKNQLARIFWAVSPRPTQKAFAVESGLHPSTLNDVFTGESEPGPSTLDRLASEVGLTVPDGERILRYVEDLRRPRLRAGRGGVEGLLRELEVLVSGLWVRLLALPLPESLPGPEDRQLAQELWLLLKDLPEDQQVAVVRRAAEFQTWALVEICCDQSEVHASRDLPRAASLARLSQEIAKAVPEPLRERARGLAAAAGANIQRVTGELRGARAALEDAKRLWASGSDPEGLFDPGRLLDLEASLLRAERRFQEALDLLKRALPVSRCPARILIKKGFTLEVMGDYASAIEALLQAESLPDFQADPRLRVIRDCNLGFCLVHVGRFAEAAGLAQKVREVAIETGDEIWVLRALWLEGRICAGLRLREAALRLLAQAREEFGRRNMPYDVALALLEEAVLMLEEGRVGEVKELAGELSKVFESKGVHREALAALQLFQEAAEREEATAELARRVLGYLFRARHVEGLRFSEV